jgi:hypothetical protein
MSCDKSKLKEIMFRAISDETGIAGVPIQIVLRRMKEQIIALNMSCNDKDVDKVIQRALDAWEIDKTLDEVSYEMMRDIGLPERSEFIWHLKILSEEKRDFWRDSKGFSNKKTN